MTERWNVDTVWVEAMATEVWLYASTDQEPVTLTPDEARLLATDLLVAATVLDPHPRKDDAVTDKPYRSNPDDSMVSASAMTTLEVPSPATPEQQAARAHRALAAIRREVTDQAQCDPHVFNASYLAGWHRIADHILLILNNHDDRAGNE